MAVTGDLFVEAIEHSRDKNEAEVFVGWSDLELLQNFGQEKHEVIGNVQIMDDNYILLS